MDENNIMNKVNKTGFPPVHFVHKQLSSWPELRHGQEQATMDLLLRVANGRDAWIINTYLRLLLRGYQVTLSDRYEPDALCVAHHDDIKVGHDVWRSFVVAVRADRDRTFICDAEIVQSPASMEYAYSYYIPHWTQPGLIPRNQNRGPVIQRIGYFGTLKNLAACFRGQDFDTALSALGVEFVIREDPATWHDFSDIDLVLVVRDGTPYFLASKPATKLFNAWSAGCPALVGAEPVYAHHRKSSYDFIQIGTVSGVISTIQKLRQDPALYQRYVDRSIERSFDIQDSEILKCWVELLQGPISERYKIWRSSNALLRRGSSIVKLFYRAARKRLRGNTYRRGYDFQGVAILDVSFKRRAATWIDRKISRLDQH